MMENPCLLVQPCSFCPLNPLSLSSPDFQTATRHHLRKATLSGPTIGPFISHTLARNGKFHLEAFQVWRIDMVSPGFASFFRQSSARARRHLLS